MRRTTALRIHILFVTLCFGVPSYGDDWPQWRGAGHDGAARQTSAFSRPFELRLAWSRPIGSGYSGVSIVGERAVTMFSDGTSDFVGAFRVDTGAEIWRVPVGEVYRGRHGSEDGPSSTPAIAAGRVFASGPRGRLLALDLDSGETLWSIDLVADHGVQVPWYGFGSSPVAVGDVVYLPAFNGDAVSGLAFAQEDGELRWTVAGNWLGYQSSIEDPGGRGLLVSDVADLSLVDPATGAERFRFTRETRGDLTHPHPVLLGTDRVLLTYETHAELYRLEPDSDPPLELLWRSRELKDCYAPPVAHGDTIYGLSGVFLVAVDAETGKRRWKSREPSARGLIVVDGQLVLLAANGDVVTVAADARGYAESARIAVAERGGYTPPSFAGGRIFVRNTSLLAAVEVVATGNGTPTQDARHGGTGVTEDGGSRRKLSPAGAFRDFVARVATAADPDSVVDEWWQRQTAFPIVEEDSIVHFVYRGEADDVALLGDMVADLTAPETMVRIGDTDLFSRSYQYELGGLWHYAFLLDFERVVTDPANPRTVADYPAQNPLSFGFDPPRVYSLLLLPQWEPPGFTRRRAEGGRLETVPFVSESAYRKRDLTAYLPAGYDAGSDAYPVLYVLGGAPWLEHAGLEEAFDGLMGSLAERAIAILVPYHKGSLDRMGPGSYVDLLLDEVVPLVEKRYRTRAPSVLLAAADDGAAAVTAAVRAPEKFERVAVHSLRIKADEIEKLGTVEKGPAAAYIEWSRYEPRQRDQNLDYRATSRRLVALLEDAGTAVESAEVATGPGWLAWASRLDRSLRVLLPRDEE